MQLVPEVAQPTWAGPHASDVQVAVVVVHAVPSQLGISLSVKPASHVRSHRAPSAAVPVIPVQVTPPSAPLVGAVISSCSHWPVRINKFARARQPACFASQPAARKRGVWASWCGARDGRVEKTQEGPVGADSRRDGG
jgi:hypothetical protein